MPFHIECARSGGLINGVGLGDTAAIMVIESVLPRNRNVATVTITVESQRPVRLGIVTARSSVAAMSACEWEGRTRF